VVESACGGGERWTGPEVREDYRGGESADLSPDELGVVVGEEISRARQLDRVRRRSALGERPYQAIPIGGALPGALDEHEVAHRNAPKCSRYET
jgi:hypothetical protein